MENNFNIFEDEFLRVADEKTYIVLSEILKMNLMDDKNQFQINLAHIRTFTHS
jgi:hypothetical protein